MPDDALQLIEKAQVGETNAFGGLITLYSKYVFSIVFRIVNNEEQAEDLVQDTFIKAWQNIGGYNPQRSKFTTWLFTIATRLSLDWLKANKRIVRLETKHYLLFESQFTSDVAMNNEDIATLISWACEKLSPQQKVVFVLRDIQQLDVDEVKEITGLSEKKINDNLYLAHKTLQIQLKNHLKIEV